MPNAAPPAMPTARYTAAMAKADPACASAACARLQSSYSGKTSTAASTTNRRRMAFSE